MPEPDPSQVLNEAEAAAKAGRYEEALEKHVWYHENALRIEPSQAGVRLSFALLSWYQLGKLYPPAVEKMRAIRDATVQLVYDEETDNEAFSDVVSLNDLMGEPQKTVELFRWLHANRPETARFAYFFGRQVLVECGEYELCGKYLKPSDDFENAVSAYKINLRFAERYATKRPRELAKVEHDCARGLFLHNVCSLVALLALNGRKPEAIEYAAKAKEFLDEPEFHMKLDIALEGAMPERWGSLNPKFWEKYLGEM